MPHRYRARPGFEANGVEVQLHVDVRMRQKAGTQTTKIKSAKSFVMVHPRKFIPSKYTRDTVYPMCARVSCVTTDLLHSLCIPFRVHIIPFIGQLVSTTCGGCGMHETHEKRFLPTTESV